LIANPLRIDLIGEDPHILLAIRTHLLSSAGPHLLNQPLSQIRAQLSCVRVDTYANAKLNALDWLHNARSLLAPNRILFLIYPSETSILDESAMGIWRNAIEKSERLRSATNENSPTTQSLQIIRGFWDETKGQKNALTPSLLSNASYAFANVTKHLRLSSPQQEEEINSFRDIPQTLNNYTCEKCSDPECEHKLFGFLKTQI